MVFVHAFTCVHVKACMCNYVYRTCIMYVCRIGDIVLPFLLFSNQKQQLKRYLDGVSDAIYIPNGFPFGLQTHTVAYVSLRCTNLFLIA